MHVVFHKIWISDGDFLYISQFLNPFWFRDPYIYFNLSEFTSKIIYFHTTQNAHVNNKNWIDQ